MLMPFLRSELIAKLAATTDIRLPSPSSASIHSSAQTSATGPLPPAAIKAPPISINNVLTCNMMHALLKSSTLAVAIPEMKELLKGVARGRGWGEGWDQKVIYGGVAKRLVIMDRKTGKGGSVVLKA